MDSLDDITNMFQAESEKLKHLINNASTKPELPIHEIIETYYQVMNVTSMGTMLTQQLDNADNNKTLLGKIQEIHKIISEKFDSDIHPKIMKNLTNSIQNTMKTLSSGNSGKKSKHVIENEAKIYEELRQKMSTKEFVEQYDQGLSHD